jgi:hypothetical protein
MVWFIPFLMTFCQMFRDAPPPHQTLVSHQLAPAIVLQHLC